MAETATRFIQGRQIPLEHDELLFIDRKFIQHHLPRTEPCELCNKSMLSHWWAVIDNNGLAVDGSCQYTKYYRWRAGEDHMATIPTDWLFTMLTAYETRGKNINDVWQFTTMDYDPRWVFTRVDPRLELGTSQNSTNEWAAYDEWRPMANTGSTVK